MKIGIFSDIHANLEAFESVLNDMRRERLEGYIFLGDLVGYGASPRECIELLRQLSRQAPMLAIAGNHDYAVAGLTPYENYAAHARLSIDWTIRQLNADENAFLSALPLVADPGQYFQEGGRPVSFCVVHANLVYPQGWGYIWDIDDAFLTFQLLMQKVCFIGHSHKPIVFTQGENVDWFLSEEIRLENELKYIVNVGSVGQPRDGNPEACYAVYDTLAGYVRLRRVAYDVAGAQKKILAAGLPGMLANRLALGK